jgi:uncharacterized protein
MIPLIFSSIKKLKVFLMNRLSLHISLSAILFSISCSAHSASFNCFKATTWVENTICSNTQLSDLDELLVSSYKKSMSRVADKKTLKLEQQQWLKSTRDICKDVECLKNAYTSRISELNEMVATNKNIFSITGNYQRYYRGKPDKDRAELSIQKLQNGQIQVKGQSIWRNDITFNTGEVEGVAMLEENQVRISDGGCGLTVIFFQNALTVENETGCGGLNVTFNGQYRKIRSGNQ